VIFAVTRIKMMKYLTLLIVTCSLLGTSLAFAKEGGDSPSMESQYLRLEKQLKSKKRDQRIEAHFGIAKLYLGIMDKREALAHLDMALALSKGREDIQKLRDDVYEEIFPTPSRLQLIRERNKENRMFMDLSFGLEGATNVTQESIQPLAPSNKDDVALVLNGLLGYRPESKLLDSWRQNLQLSLASYLYSDLKNSNLISSNFEHRLSSVLEPGDHQLSIDGYWGLGHVNSDHKDFLWSYNVGMNWRLLDKGLLFQPHGSLSVTQSTYFDNLYSSEEGFSFKFNLGGDVPLESKFGKKILTNLRYQREDLKSGASSYEELGLQVRYPLTLKNMMLKSVTPYLEMSERSYDEIDTGSSVKRSDGKWKAGVEALVSQKDHHRLTFNLFTMENDSNDLVYHYRNTQLSILYGISL